MRRRCGDNPSRVHHRASRSEIVVPIIVADRLIGVFDVDSPEPDRFDDQDRRGLEALIDTFVEAIKA